MRLRAGWIACTLALAASLRAPAARGALTINEFLYDPAGADTGREWIELYNDAPWPASLDRAELQTADGGSDGAVTWRVIWRGAAGGSVPPHGFSTVGANGGTPPVDFPAGITLGNGPDALRLVYDELELDRVAWGDVRPSELAEGSPAPRVSSGESLARRIDGDDRGDNAADFRPARPSPGRSNWPEADVSIAWAAPSRLLPVPRGSGIVLPLYLKNEGRTVAYWTELALDLTPVGAVRWPSSGNRWIEPGAELHMAIELERLLDEPGDRGIGFGPTSIAARLRFPRDTWSANDADSLRIWRALPPLRFSELYPRPETGAGEWIELSWTVDLLPDCRGWSIEDARGTRLFLDSLGTGAGAPRAHETVALVAFEQPVDATSVDDAPTRWVAWQGSWPSLNDSAEPGAAADTLFLRGPAGEIADWAAFGKLGRGEAWQRRADAPAGTGLDEWRTAVPSPGELDTTETSALPRDGDLAPRALGLDHRPDGLWLRVDPRTAHGAYRLRVFDLLGQVLWAESGEVGRTEERWSHWDARRADGSLAPIGLYVAELQSRGESEGRRIERQTFVLDR